MEWSGVEMENQSQKYTVDLGIYDIPIKQQQPPFKVDLLKSHIALFGMSMSGKTNFLTTMLHELRHSPDSYLVPSPMDELTKAMFEENDGIIYTMHEPVPATPAGTMPPPQLWRLKDKNKMTGLFIPSYSLTIFDGAGEDIEHIDPVVSRYINESKVLVILIDPLALPGVASTIEEDILNWSTTADHVNDASAKMVDGIADYVRNNCGLPPGKLINRDVAVVFTKIDTVRESFGSAVVMNPSPHLAKKVLIKQMQTQSMQR